VFEVLKIVYLMSVVDEDTTTHLAVKEWVDGQTFL
jgi:hypothetical protein